jgi:hypothetical protein
MKETPTMAQESWTIYPGEHKTIDLEVVRALKASLIGGQLDVIGHDERSARIEVGDVHGKELKVTIDGDRLEVDHPQWRWDNFIDVFSAWRGKARADVTLLVPRDVALKLGVVSATALVSGLTGPGKLSTVSGEITVDGATGDLDLNTVSGELTARDHHGAVSAHTVSGDVTVSGVVPKFTVESVSGNVYLDLFGHPREVRTSTVSGDVTLRLDPDLGVHYRVTSVSGVSHLDGTTTVRTMGKSFVQDSGPTTGPGSSDPGSDQQSAGVHWVTVSSNSVSGNVSVVRRIDPAEREAPARREAAGGRATGTPGADAFTSPAAESAPPASADDTEDGVS